MSLCVASDLNNLTPFLDDLIRYTDMDIYLSKSALKDGEGGAGGLG